MFNFTRKIAVAIFVILAIVNAQAANSNRDKMPNVIKELGAGFEIFDAPPVTRKILLGIGSPIFYNAQVQKGQQCVAVVALFEPFHGRVGKRVMELSAEGATSQIVDAVKLAGWRTPGAVAIEARDMDEDGWIKVTVSAHKSAEDRNVNPAGVWVFDKAKWDELKTTPAEVITGKYDAQAYYVVDCGSEESFYPTLSFANKIVAARDSLAGLNLVAAEKIVAKEITREVEKLNSRFGEIESLYTNASYRELSRVLGDFNDEVHGIRSKALKKLLAKYNPKIKVPAQTHLANPWGAIIHLRQEDKLRVNFNVLPHPQSLDHKYHPRYAAKEPWGWVDFETNAKSRRLSKSLGLDYDMGLEEICYDPLSTKYIYEEGSLEVDVMDKAAIRIHSNSLKLGVGIDPAKMKTNRGLIYTSIDSINSTKIFSAIIFKDTTAANARAQIESGGKVSCAGVTLFWADSLVELKTLAQSLRDWDKSQAQMRKWIKESLVPIQPKGREKIIGRMETDKRTVLALAQKFGGISASLDGGYEAIWNRDTTNVLTAVALSGDPKYLALWNDYVINNPVPDEIDGKEYNVYVIAPYDGQYKFKMEDDGLFYAAHAVYANWKMRSDSANLAKYYTKLEEALVWLRKRAYSEKIGLYSESLINEVPLKSSPFWEDEKVDGVKVGDDWPMHFHSIYINNIMYATHLMMCEMAKAIGDEVQSGIQFAYAQQLSEKINTRLWDEKNGYYYSGIAVMDDGREIPLDWRWGGTYFDVIWGFSLFPIQPHSGRSTVTLDAVMHDGDDFPVHGGKWHMSAGLGHAATAYCWAGEFEKAHACADYLVEYSGGSEYNDTFGALYAMSGSVPEWTFSRKFHRPQTFALAPLLQGMTSTAVALDYNGVNISANNYLAGIDHVIFKDSILNVDLAGFDNARGLIVDGKEIENTMRIPLKYLTKGEHDVCFLPGETSEPVLLYSNLELIKIKKASGYLEFYLNGFGNGFLRFSSLKKGAIKIFDNKGQLQDFDYWKMAGSDCVSVTVSGEPVMMRIKL